MATGDWWKERAEQRQKEQRRGLTNAITKLIEGEWVITDEVDKKTGKKGIPCKLVDHWRRILNFAFTPKADGSMPYRTIILSCPKKSAKTEHAAAVTWAWARHFGGEIYSCANDQQQSAGRMFKRIYEFLDYKKREDRDWYDDAVLRHNYDLIELADPKTDRFMENREVWASITPLAVDPAGEAGARNSLVVFDELWGYKGDLAERFWEELQPIPTIPHSTRIVVTYAGFYGESNLLYDLYEKCVKPDPEAPGDEDLYRGTRIPELSDLPCYTDGQMFCYWDHKARMPWHTPAFLAAARSETRPSQYLRLWENRWTTGKEAFIDMDIFDELCAAGEKMGLRNHFADVAALVGLNNQE